MKNEKLFIGPFSIELQLFLDEKHAMGIKYIDEKRMMHIFDKLSLTYDCSDGLSKELVQKFIEPKPHWAQSTYEKHINLITQIGRFLHLLEIKAYMPDTKLKIIPNRFFSPYIFTENEIKSIFNVIDNHIVNRTYIRSNEFYPAIFRLLYSSGLRVTEALLLTMKDVDLITATIMIKNSKNHKDRLLPIHPQVIPFMKNFSEKYHKFYQKDDYFFTPPNGGHYDKGTVYHRFRKILFQCNISHGGRRKGGPRLHDLRHTFCVRSLRNFLENGVDYRSALPILSAYMGHSNLSATGKYLRLTAEAYPEILAQLEADFGDIIPNWEVNKNEAN